MEAARLGAAQSGATVAGPTNDGLAHASSLWFDEAVRLHAWMREHGYAGYDLHDALASPLLQRLTFGNRWLGVGWTQVGKRISPRLRSVLGVRPLRNAKTGGLLLAAAVRLGRASGDSRWESEAAAHRLWLDENAQREDDTAGWGYPFPWANRDFFAPAGTPSGVATAFIGHALLDAAESYGDARAAELGLAAARFVQRRLRRVPLGDGFAFSYTPLDTRVVHNASVLAASLLARAGAITDDDAMLTDALSAARATAARQATDGSWPYGAGRRNAWIDSFHTSYLLVALDQVRAATGSDELDAVIQRGVAFWRSAFFTGPAVSFHPARPYPVDMHAVAHSVVALRALESRVPAARAEAERLAYWSLSEMQDVDGAFYYRRRSASQVERTKFMRWTQAWMLFALAELAAWR